MKNLSLNDLQVFVVVAQCGTISEAARKLDSSPATLGRRMAQLESAIGMKLFHRYRSGYELTRDGETVLAELRPMAQGVQDFERWLGNRGSRPRVRLSGGTWTMRFLAQRFSRLSLPDDDFDVMLLTGEARMNIEQREIDIGLRNAAPTSPNLASRRLTDVAYAAFVHDSLGQGAALPWIGIEPDHAVTRSSAWVLENHADDIATYVSNPGTLFDLVISGVGVAVLPCFIGDSIPGLRRHGDVIEELTESQHIVFHNDARHEPHIRAVGDRIVDTVLQHADLYGGKLHQMA
ncbi:MAG: LysR family transcriptional regulator [Pseudomonadota bacterium]